jgi:hypothetical protein
VITIDLSGIAADIERYARTVTAEVAEATDMAAGYVQQRLRQRAEEDERWASLSNDIMVWSKDGSLVIGLAHQEFVSQAMALEYGDEVTPPSPLFRTASPDIAKAQAIANEHVVSTLK